MKSEQRVALVKSYAYSILDQVEKLAQEARETQTADGAAAAAAAGHNAASRLSEALFWIGSMAK